ncbi:hypothetical protein C5O80_31775 [Burkholderia sp. SRS-46]|nr:hypothetical protein C5O80_31775 [Burkholderia sp. SRS-46]
MKTLAWILLAAGLSAGCSKNETPSPPASDSASASAIAAPTANSAASEPARLPATPATAASLAGADDAGNPPDSPHAMPPQSPTSPINVLRIDVHQKGTSSGVPADIYRIASDGNKYYVATTDQSGTVTPNSSCLNTDRFNVTTTLPDYLDPGPQACGPVVHFEVSTAQAAYALVKLGGDAFKADRFGEAQAYFSAAADALQQSRPGDAHFLRGQALLSAGKMLGVDVPTATVNGVPTATIEFTRKLRQFQSSQNLTPTGKLDDSTVQSLGGIGKTEALQRALKISPDRIQKFRVDEAPPSTAVPNQPERNPSRALPRYDLRGLAGVQRGG